MRGDTVFDPIYWRTWEETLTVDYSTWLASLPKFFYRQRLVPAHSGRIVAGSVLFTQRLPEPYRFRMGEDPRISHHCHHRRLGGRSSWLSTRIGVEPQYETFVEKTERTFGVSRLKCETLAGCPSDKLPEDRTPATWVQGDRYVKGWILVDNNKVSLAGSHGILLTSKES